MESRTPDCEEVGAPYLDSDIRHFHLNRGTAMIIPRDITISSDKARDATPCRGKMGENTADGCPP